MKNIFYFTLLLIITLISGIIALCTPANLFLYFSENPYQHLLASSKLFKILLPIINYIAVFGYSILYGLALVLTYSSLKQGKRLNALLFQLLPLICVLFIFIFFGTTGIKDQFSFPGWN